MVWDLTLGMRMRRHAVPWVVAGALGVLSALPAAQQPKFFPDDPLLADDDMLDVAAEPVEIDLSDLFDRFGHIVRDLGTPDLTEAVNANTLDEVPDSSWFTNRHGRQRLSIADLARGPDAGDGPDMATPWRVFRTKIGGLTPGFPDHRRSRRSVRHQVRPGGDSGAQLCSRDHRHEAVLRDRLQHTGELHRGDGSRSRAHDRAGNEARGRVRR